MPDLKRFQKATVKVALKALTRTDGTRRFLIADEVGLGKTLVAGEIIRLMAARKNEPLVVLYVCSNLSIAAQNRKRLVEWLPEEEREEAVSRVDRLTLLPERDAPTGTKIHLYTLTPDTSVPMRVGKRRDGRKEERALIHALVKKIWPEFFSERKSTYFRGNVGSTVWKEQVKQKLGLIENRTSCMLREMFRDSVRKELKLEEGMHVMTALNRIEEEHQEEGALEIIARLRNALAAGAIERLHPDLVIFDEFQRFRDLLEDDVDSSATRVVGALRGEGTGSQPGLLLLSATPYRPYTRQWQDERDGSHKDEFFDLLKFLYRRTGKADRISIACESALTVMEQELRKGSFGSELYTDARKTMEKHLRAVICRTERVSHQPRRGELRTSSLPTTLNSADLKVFKHLAQSFSDRHKSVAPSYWSSVPLPMQTMGPAYETWKAAAEIKDTSIPSLKRGQRDRFKQLPDPAHPRLRALKSLLPSGRLALPWIAPSAPWWPLSGPWKTQRNGDVGKVIVFSRFRAVPQAISSLLSYDLEAHLLSSDSIRYEDLSKRRSLQPKAGNEALLGHFYPSIFLVRNTDPIANGVGSTKLAKESIKKQLRKALRDMGIRVLKSKEKRPTWSLIAALERKQVGTFEAFDKILNRWSSLHTRSSASKDDSGSGFERVLNAWRKAAGREIKHITPAELDGLVRYALSAPGVVTGRALARHWDGALEAEGFVKCIEVSWKGLRNYLSSRLFMKELKGSERRYPEAIQRAVLEGNLESVLDEHLWITSKLGGITGAKLANELLEGLQVRTSNFFMHPLGKKSKRGRFSLRCHAAMPFTDPRAGGSSSQLLGDGNKPIRSDELRKAFNTPFWPHVLATTSVGQEGLDFHVWCETLLHWDLSSNPVDIEQREGRIRRYGGLSIRRHLTKRLWNKGIHIPHLTSPWAKLEKIAEKKYTDDAGLSPWWICEGADVKRYIIDLPASEQKHRLELLRKQRFLYRLALGQPNQEDLLEVLSAKYGVDPNLMRVGLNLSPFFCTGHQPEG